MNQATLNGLTQSRSKLCVYRAVTAADPAGRPVLWAQVDPSMNTEIKWTDTWTAYTSTTPITGGRQISVGFSTEITLGQTLKVAAGGTGNVFNDGQPTMISILNTTGTRYTCGMCCAANGGAAGPFCAFPLDGNNLQTITPLQTVLLQFTNQPAAPGTIVDDSAAEFAYTPGYLINLTTSANQRQVNYDIDTGWSCGGAAWATPVSAGTSLVGILIQQ